jgi:hypothetical protein
MNTKAALTIIVVFIIILVGGVALYFKLSTSSTQNPIVTEPGTTTGGTNTTPGGNTTTVVPTQGGTAEEGIAVAAQGGNSIIVKDFKKDPETKAYPDKSLYYLSGGLTPNASSTAFSIFYVEADKSFHITLLRNPLGETRKNAEKVLLAKLGLTEAQACSLVVYVGVSEDVSPDLAGEELGLSFCPGAVAL